MFSPVIKQTWYVSPILLIMLGFGMSIGCASCFTFGIQAPESTIKASVEDISWIVASFGTATMIGYLLSSLLMDWLGRRITFIIACLPYLVGTVFLYAASNVALLICGRIITGASAGATGLLGPAIVGEFCAPKYRGIFLNLKACAFYIGSFIVHVLGHHIHWRTVALICATPYVLALFITLTCSDTPSWLAMKHRFRESEEVFYNLRGISENSKREIKSMIRAQRATVEHKQSVIQMIKNVAMKFTKRNFLKPALITVFACILLETGGRHILPSYADLIITKITGNKTDAFYNTLAVDLLLIFSLCLSTYLLRVVKVRTLLFSTGLFSCVVLFIGCVYLYLVDNDMITNVSAVAMVLFAINFISVNLGCVPVAMVVISEIFPVEHRAFGISSSGYLVASFMTVALKTLPVMLHSIEIYGAFSVLNLLTAVSLVVLWFILPETKDRTLQEVEDYFTTGKFRDYESSDEEVNVQIIRKKDRDNSVLENTKVIDDI